MKGQVWLGVIVAGIGLAIYMQSQKNKTESTSSCSACG